MSTDSQTATATDTSADEETVLHVDGLTKRFGGLTAVDDLSFDVSRQEILGFIGPNGAGKSTTFNCIFGTYKPTSGNVYFNGEDVTAKPAYEMVEKGMARTFQTFRPLPDRNVLSNVELANVDNRLITLSGLFGSTAAEAADICERVGLGDDMYKMPDELPHAGMIRLEIARAIATDPELLLVDEPFAGLSGQEVAGLSELFENLRQEGMTLIVVDHNMRGLLNLIDRAVVINFGERIADGSPEEIKNNPTVQEAYLGGSEI
jgi:branched-chain amino acid transport system ATP-binding protein